MPSSLTPAEKIVDDIEHLQGKMRTIDAGLEEMKRKARAGQKISLGELDIVVKDVDRLSALMNERKTDGH
jgi:hypothetical protein